MIKSTMSIRRPMALLLFLDRKREISAFQFDSLTDNLHTIPIISMEEAKAHLGPSQSDKNMKNNN